MSDRRKTLYERLGGYDAIAAVSADLVTRLQKDSQLSRFWAHRGADGVKRELQLLIDYLARAPADRSTTVVAIWSLPIAGCASVRVTGTGFSDTQRRR